MRLRLIAAVTFLFVMVSLSLWQGHVSRRQSAMTRELEALAFEHDVMLRGTTDGFVHVKRAPNGTFLYLDHGQWTTTPPPPNDLGVRPRPATFDMPPSRSGSRPRPLDFPRFRRLP